MLDVPPHNNKRRMGAMREMNILEGNISAGKTELLRYLETTSEFGVLEEPVEQWRTGFPDNLLELYYSKPRRWAFMLQIAAFVTRAKTWDEILGMTDHSKILMERSVYSDRNVFARLLYESGDMTETEYLLYCQLWDFMAAQWAVVPNRIFYLRTPASECLRRIAGRGRPEEAGIALEFLERIENLHDKWLLGRDDVVVLDGLKSTSELAQEIIKRCLT